MQHARCLEQSPAYMHPVVCVATAARVVRPACAWCPSRVRVCDTHGGFTPWVVFCLLCPVSALVDLVSRAAENAPAFEKMPTTPWSILNKPQEDSEEDDA